MIAVGSVFKKQDQDEEIRIIFTDYQSDVCYYVFIHCFIAIPIFGSTKEMQNQVNELTLIEITDPFQRIIDEDQLSTAEKTKRDEQYQVVEKYWNSTNLLFLERKSRMDTFKKISENENIPLANVRRIFSRFWQRGMNKNALLPDFGNSGGKDEPKQYKSKTGRPRIHALHGEFIGSNVTEMAKKQFEAAYRKYYLTKQSKSLREVYRHVLNDYYSVQINEQNQTQKYLHDHSVIPTFGQFYYWYGKNHDKIKELIARKGQNKYDLTKRPLKSSTALETTGPGFRYQVDATIADIYLVSESNREKIIGRPTIYAMIDVYSRMITAIYIGLESPSWNGAMMVLDNMIADKVEFCRQFDIEIEEEEWPCCYIPECIIADRGEFESTAPEKLINNYNITIENTAPYRGDMKGIVERLFRSFNQQFKENLPGAVMKDNRKRGDDDYRLNAKCTLSDLTRIVVLMVLKHNSTQVEKYELLPEMIADEVIPIPIKMWQWGIQNGKGVLRNVDRNTFRMNILPRAKATVTRGAIKFKGLYYMATEMIENRMLDGSQRSVEVIYDPRNIRNIYVQGEKNKEFIVFTLDERSIAFSSYMLEDAIAANQQKNTLHKAAEDISLERQMQLDDELRKIAKKSELLTGKSDHAKSERTGNIRKNHAVEKGAQRVKEAFVPENDKISARVIPLYGEAKTESGTDKAHEEQIDMIARILEEDDEHGDDNK